MGVWQLAELLRMQIWTMLKPILVMRLLVLLGEIVCFVKDRLCSEKFRYDFCDGLEALNGTQSRLGFWFGSYVHH
ncbi:hypothetical protein QBC36DRAFT_324092 [Triangularia setosa]|uniref:Uncharacterized protein n=1 Tax=Triangularia setosa TaxID=2587417 RepID=A0AAN6WC31_9PEZI|nr:hypothetical protein QBC36DRAFT_324092 [Podospora setosa]